MKLVNLLFPCSDFRFFFCFRRLVVIYLFVILLFGQLLMLFPRRITGTLWCYLYEFWRIEWWWWWWYITAWNSN